MSYERVPVKYKGFIIRIWGSNPMQTTYEYQYEVYKNDKKIFDGNFTNVPDKKWVVKELKEKINFMQYRPKNNMVNKKLSHKKILSGKDLTKENIIFLFTKEIKRVPSKSELEFIFERGYFNPMEW